MRSSCCAVSVSRGSAPRPGSLPAIRSLQHEYRPDFPLLPSSLLAFSEENEGRRTAIEEKLWIQEKKEPLDHCTSSVCAKTYYGGGGEKACTVASQPVLEKSFVFLYKHHYPLTLTSAFTTAVFLCYFSDDIRAAVACCGVLILLRTNARFNHCLQNVKTYVENTKLLKQPPKESSQVRLTLDLLFRLASAQDSLDCTVAPRPGWGMRQKTQEHTHR